MAEQQRRFIYVVLGICVSLGLMILLYRYLNWPAARWIRNYGGDIVAAVFVYFPIQLVTKLSSWKTAVMAFSIACLIEGNQLWWGVLTSHNSVAATLAGTSFDWMDIVMYATGVLISLVIHSMHTHQTSHDAHSARDAW